mmetsp:Transcript_41097/g.53921  ORF Transcript_41097/g.53921 Transcript_41097/m.53921 type:complete len:97 (-) Transcript_41097:865-1155(-)
MNKRKQKKQETEQRQQQEEEMLFAEESFDREEPSNNEQQAVEIERLRTINKKLRRKYQEAAQEIKTLTREADSNKDELLDIVRTQEKDIKFYEKVV